jgi:hypothetical protein
MELIAGMKNLEQISKKRLTGNDIDVLNAEYKEIHDLMFFLREETEFVEEVRKPTLQIPYILGNQDIWVLATNLYRLPSNEPNITESLDNSANEEVIQTNNVTPIQSKRAAPHIRKHLLQNEVFGKNREILPDQIISKKREKMIQILSDDPINAHIYKWDCLAASDEKSPNIELSDKTITHAIQSAKQRKDGALIQAIKNNLIQTAANDESFDPNMATSPLLADHISNITPNNPIILRTVEFPVFHITAIRTVDYGDESYYKARVMLANGKKKTFLMLAGGCAVWDLSNKIVGEIAATWKLIPQNIPCTIRNIRSTIQPKKSKEVPITTSTKSIITKWASWIKKTFGFGRK